MSRNELIVEVDPVCGMTVSDASEYRTVYNENEYLFCSAHCANAFEQNPTKYLHNDTLKDPVCGMDVADKAEYHTEYKSKKYYFCSEHCQNKFEEDAEQYLNNFQTPEHSHAQQHIDKSVIYTCPMPLAKSISR